MDLESTVLSEGKQRKTSIIMTSHTQNLKNNTNELYLQNRNRLTDRENKLTVTKGGRGRGIS